MTIGNAKAVDLFAEKGDQRIAVQVKSIYKKKNVGFPIMIDQVRDDCNCIFVYLNGDKMTMPDYYVCTPSEARTRVKQYATRGKIDLSSLNNEEFKNNWEKLNG